MSRFTVRKRSISDSLCGLLNGGINEHGDIGTKTNIIAGNGDDVILTHVLGENVLRAGFQEGGNRDAMWLHLGPGAFGVAIVPAVLVGRGEHTRAQPLEVQEGILEICGIKNVIV